MSSRKVERFGFWIFDRSSDGMFAVVLECGLHDAKFCGAEILSVCAARWFDGEESSVPVDEIEVWCVRLVDPVRERGKEFARERTDPGVLRWFRYVDKHGYDDARERHSLRMPDLVLAAARRCEKDFRFAPRSLGTLKRMLAASEVRRRKAALLKKGRWRSEEDTEHGRRAKHRRSQRGRNQ